MLEKVEINDAAAVQLLKSAEVRAELVRRGNRIASAAPGANDVDVRYTPTRVHVTVTTADFKARKAEATNRSLSRALDSGRG